jgi:hypothetical protein
MQDIIRQLDEQRAAALMGGGQRRIDAQHAKGKLTARASNCCSMPTRSKSGTCSWNTAVTTSVWTRCAFRETAW